MQICVRTTLRATSTGYRLLRQNSTSSLFDPYTLTRTMSLRKRLSSIDHSIRLKGNDALHEQTDAWSNRDLIPLPPWRRTWGWFNFFGFWAIGSLNLANWQTPSTYLSMYTRVRMKVPRRSSTLTDTSNGPLCPASDADHCGWETAYRNVLGAHRLVRSQMAYWVETL